MKRDELSDLASFVVIASERSFTKAAARLELSASALSHAMRTLETRLGVQLLRRTTRSTATTEAGERLLTQLQPALQDIRSALAELGAYRGKPAGRVRISAYRAAAINLIAPKLPRLREKFPDVVVELIVEDGLIDIVTAGFDAGVRPGNELAKDMIAVRISPDERAVVVGAPSYFENRGMPSSPEELAQHACLVYRYVFSGNIFRWQFEKNGRAFSIAVAVSFITNDAGLLAEAALTGMGLAYVLESQVAVELESGALVSVLDSWCPEFAGAYLYYPSQRQIPPAMRAVIDALRHPLG